MISKSVEREYSWEYTQLEKVKKKTIQCKNSTHKKKRSELRSLSPPVVVSEEEISRRRFQGFKIWDFYFPLFFFPSWTETGSGRQRQQYSYSITRKVALDWHCNSRSETLQLKLAKTVVYRRQTQHVRTSPGTSTGTATEPFPGETISTSLLRPRIYVFQILFLYLKCTSDPLLHYENIYVVPFVWTKSILRIDVSTRESKLCVCCFTFFQQQFTWNFHVFFFCDNNHFGRKRDVGKQQEKKENSMHK